MIKRTGDDFNHLVASSPRGFSLSRLPFPWGYLTNFDFVAMQGAGRCTLGQLDAFLTVAYLDEGFAVTSKNKKAAGIRFTHGLLLKVSYASN